MQSATWFLQLLELVVGYLACGLVGLFGLVLIWKIYDNTIKLDTLLTDEDGTASTSRFQLVIFTFVVALSFFLVVVSNVKIRQWGGPPKTGTSQGDEDKSPLPDVPGGVLALLGISASSYLVSKGISNSGNGNGNGNGNGAATKQNTGTDANAKTDANTTAKPSTDTPKSSASTTPK